MRDELLIKMIKSNVFTKELVLHYLILKKGNTKIHNVLIEKIKSFDEPDIKELLPFICYFDVLYPSQAIEKLLCELSSKNFEMYYMSQIYVEAYAKEYMVSNRKVRGRIDDLVEALESSMVNKDPRYNLLPSKANFEMLENASPVYLMEIAINKRVRNDFKDNVKAFFGEIIKPCYYLKNIEDSNRQKVMKKHLQMINIWLHKRRRVDDTPTREAIELSHGFILPFRTFKDSNVVVRVVKDEVKVFETRERAPYFFVVETVE